MIVAMVYWVTPGLSAERKGFPIRRATPRG